MNLTVSREGAIKSHTTSVELDPYSIFSSRNQKNHWNCHYTGPVLSINVGRSDTMDRLMDRRPADEVVPIASQWQSHVRGHTTTHGYLSTSVCLGCITFHWHLDSERLARCSKESTEGPDVVAMSSSGGRLLISIVLRKGN